MSQDVDYVLLEDLANSAEPQKQTAALSRVLQAIRARKEVSIHWPTVLQYCVNSDNVDVRKLAYGTLTACHVPLSEWERVTSTIASDLCSFEPTMRIAALGAIQHFPLSLIIAREVDAPGQIWIGGGKDEVPEAHVAALTALSCLAFREHFSDMQHLLYDSWNFVVDHALEPGPPLCPAIALVSSLFGLVSGFERVVPDFDGAETESDLSDSLRPVADHVAASLLPHLEALFESVQSLSDSAKPNCLYALTHLSLLAIAADDSATLETPLGDVIPSTSSPPPPPPQPQQAPADHRGRIVKLVAKFFLGWLESADAPLMCRAARNLIVLARAVPIDGASWTAAAVGVLTTLLRKDSPMNREIIRTLVPVIPRLNPCYAATVLAHVIGAIICIPDRATRISLMTDAFTVALFRGHAPLAKAVVAQQLFREAAVAALWRDDKRQQSAEEFLLALVTAIRSGLSAATVETAAKVWEAMIGCLTWSVREHAHPVTVFFRFSHDLLTRLATAKGLEAVFDRAVETLREVFQVTLPRIQSDVVSIQVIHLIVRHLPVRDLESEERYLPLLSILKSAFLRMDEFDKFAVALSKARRSGKLAHPSLIERPRAVQLQPALHCLLVLASRVPALVQSVYTIVDEFGRFFLPDDRATFDHIQSLKFRIYSLKSSPPPLAPPTCASYPIANELLDAPLMSRDDDVLLLSLSRAAAAVNSVPTRRVPSPYETVSGQSDMFSVSVSHCTNPSIRRITLFVKVTNVTSLTLAGGMLYALTPEHLRLWRDDAPQFVESILRTEAHASRNVVLPLLVTRFAPIRVTFRLAVSVPKVEVPEEEDTTAAAAAAAAQARKKDADQGKPRTPSAASHDATDADVQAAEAEVWPDLYTEPHAVEPLELVDPLPLSPSLFSAIWPRMPASTVEDYLVPASSGLRADMLPTRFAGLPIAEISRRWWGAGTCFELTYACVSWFDDVLGLVVTGRQRPQSLCVRFQWRSSSPLALANLHSAMPRLISVLLASSAVLLREGDAGNAFLEPSSEGSNVSANEKLQLARWNELRPK